MLLLLSPNKIDFKFIITLITCGYKYLEKKAATQGEIYKKFYGEVAAAYNEYRGVLTDINKKIVKVTSGGTISMFTCNSNIQQLTLIFATIDY